MEINRTHKKLLLTVIFVFIVGYNWSQSKKDTTDIITSVLIGLLSDEGGRNDIPTHPRLKYRITYFYFGEQNALESFKKYIKESSIFKLEEFKFQKSEHENPVTAVFSKEHFLLFNNYYKYKKANFLFTDADDENYVFYWGRLKKSKFKSKNQKLMFLKGAFIRNGSISNKGKYRYGFSNSASKYKLVYRFLKQTGSKILSCRSSKKTTPGSVVILFEPSEELKKVIDK